MCRVLTWTLNTASIWSPSEHSGRLDALSVNVFNSLKGIPFGIWPEVRLGYYFCSLFNQWKIAKTIKMIVYRVYFNNPKSIPTTKQTRRFL